MYPEILSNLVITKVYFSSDMYTEKNSKLSRINRQSWAIVVKYEGETEYYSNGKKYISNIDNVVVLPKGCSYNWMCTKPGHFYIIEFDSNSVWDEVFCFNVTHGEKILKKIKELEYKSTIKKPMYDMESIRDTYSILLMIMNEQQKKYTPTEKRAKILPAIEYIAKNYSVDIKNDYLAAMCNLSTVYFRKLFTEVYGISPISYVHELRIKKAIEMLKSDYGSITEIALSLGYQNIYDFSRVFKKHTGISPSKY